MKRLLWWFLAVLVSVSAGCMLISGMLAFNTLRNTQKDVFNAKFSVAAQRAATAAEQAVALGMPLSDQSPLEAMLARETILEPAIAGFGIVSAQGQALLGQRPAHTTQPTLTLLEQPIRNDLGETIAKVALYYDTSARLQAEQQLRQRITTATWTALLGVCAATLVAGFALLRHIGTPHARRARPLITGGLRLSLTAMAALVLSLGMLWIGWQAHRAGQDLIQPDQLAKTAAIVRSSAGLIERGLAAGIPAQALVGLDAHTDRLRQENPEIASLSFIATTGHALYGAVPTATEKRLASTAPVTHAGMAVGELVVVLDPSILARLLQATLLDMVFLGAISLLMALELLALALGSRGARALASTEVRQQRLAHPEQQHTPWRTTSASSVRPALFLFMLSEELTRPFLPGWARQIAPEGQTLSPELLAGLPLVLFLATVALLQWPLASWSERRGRKPGFILGALLSATGLALAAATQHYGLFLAARLLSAAGFALVFVSGQGLVIDGSMPADRARSLAQFVRAILVAGLCGPSLGGLIADHWGVQTAFAICSVLALLVAAVAWMQLPPSTPAAPTAQERPSTNPTHTLGTVLRQPGLMTLLIGCALPAKLLLAALCFYLLPVYLQDTGHSSATIGRLQTIYPLTMVLLVPLAARLADRWGRRSLFVLMGGLLAGCSAMLAWPTGTSTTALALVLLGLGLGQSLSIAPQSALIADFARNAPAGQSAGILGLFRLVERGGSALGPATGAMLLTAWGFGPALACIGLLVLGGSVTYGWHLFQQPADTPPPQPAH